MAHFRFGGGLAADAPVANLTERGLFVRIGAELSFGESVTVRIFGLELEGQVLFVSADPPGAVIGFDADLEARATLIRHLDDVEVLPSQGVVRTDDPWDEPTAAGITTTTTDAESAVDPLAPLPDPEPLQSGDYAPIVADAPLEAAPTGLDPALLAAAAIDDGVSEDPFRETAPQLEAVEAPSTPPEDDIDVDVDVDVDIEAPVESDGVYDTWPAPSADVAEDGPSRAEAAQALASPVSSPEMPAAPRPSAEPPREPLPEPTGEADLSEPELPNRDWEEPEVPTLSSQEAVATPDVVLGEPEHPRVSGEFAAVSQDLPVRSPSGMLVTPAEALASDLVAPISPEESAMEAAIEASFSDDVVETIDPADPVASLPRLERDGFTVRFHSPEAYRTQLAHNLTHGGLVVQAGPLAIGTQRMLALVVPGQDAYTVSARVIFNDAGKLGFMLDSFALHKARLQSLGG